MKPQITTEKGQVFTLEKKLGEGGQGRVFSLQEKVTGKSLAVKIIRSQSSQDSERLRNRLAAVKRMPLEDIPLARPLALLAPPYSGYVMELATGMESLQGLAVPPKDGIAQWFLNTGGLRRRMQLLISLARTLAELHSRGIIYGDLSAANVFVSSELAHHAVFLIDLDNLRMHTSGHEYIYTPGYGAPEVVNQKSGISSLSDIYAFAILSFQLLTLVHPFVGDMVSDGEPELEEQAFEGQLPWIEDGTDTQNLCSAGIPRDMVLSSNMKKLFAQTFEGGRREPTQRPGMNHWVEVLEVAFRALLQCPTCSSAFFFNAHEDACPFCNGLHERPISIRVVAWEPGEEWEHESDQMHTKAIKRTREDKRLRIATFLCLKSQTIDVYENDLLLSRPLDEGRLLMKCTPQENEWDLALAQSWLRTDLRTMKTKPIAGLIKLHREEQGQWLLHLKPLSEPQRAILI